MKLLRFILVFLITVAITVALNFKIGDVPPLGKFLDPYNGFWQNIEHEYQDQRLHIPGLQQEVRVHYDQYLIPHIIAENDHDLYLAQGYITARHRLWQMEFQTHAAAGRISELIGEQALDFDRLQRRKGMVFGAQSAQAAFNRNDTIKSAVEAYAEGVNYFINSLSYKDLPIEYKLLDYAPENWNSLKTALLLKYMADDLSGWDADLENTNAYHLLGPERFDFLFPDTLNNTDPVIPNQTRYNFEPVKVDTPALFVPPAPPNISFSKTDPDNGSNNWVVGGEKTNSGSPILANDPHLGLNLPSIWFVMQLNAPGVNVMGATLPGALGVIIGHNENISWGVTNARRDVRDWYSIEFKDGEKNEYLFDNKWLKTQKVAEEIKIRGGDSFFDTVVYTHYGPVVYDGNYSKSKNLHNFSLRWIAHDPSEEQLTFYLLNRGKNYDDYVNALKYYSAPAQNFAFASKTGDIALWVQGKFPLKWPGQGKFLLDGSRLDQEWQGYIPFNHNAHLVNPEQKYLSSANQYPVGKNYPYYVYDGNFEDYRNRRINSRLSAMRNITPQDMMALQQDNYNLKAAESLPMMLAGLDINQLTAQQKEIYSLLSNWDFNNEMQSKAATVYEIWWETLYELIWDEFDRADMALNAPDDNTTLFILKNHPADPFIDIKATPETEGLQEILSQSYLAATDSVKKWTEEKEEDFTWSNFKATRLQHLLRLDAFSIHNVAIGGNKGIINAVSKTHGPSWRMVVSMEDEVKAWGIYPGGQSGNPGSPYYDNFVESWRKGEYIPLLFLKNASDTTEVMMTHVLDPENQE